MKSYLHMGYSEVVDKLNSNKNNVLPTLNISVLRNITLEPILDTFLRYFMLEIGYKANVMFGDYDNILQEAVGKRPDLLNNNVDCVLVFSQLETLSNIISRNYLQCSQNEIENEKERIVNYMTQTLNGIREQTQALILWCGFEVPIYPLAGILDKPNSMYQISTINWLNNQLNQVLFGNTNAYYIDINLCIARVGARNFYDKRYWYIGHAPYSKEACREISYEIFKHIKTSKSKCKKCIVLDCDNVLWGGIVGEDSLSGIKLGKDYPGLAYHEFQQEILNLYNRGTILTICSKNNEEDVWEVFENHPYMVLKREHISASRINWDDKATNISSISKELNISLDSIVFVDDSQHEIEMVNYALPQVETIHLQKNRAFEYRDILASCGLFDILSITNEDKLRGQMYRTEAQRNKFAQEFTDMECYYNSLEMEVSIYFSNSFYIPRIAQLTQRTNQFNLTTKRYSEDDIKMLTESKDYDVICIQLKDRFGDLGIVGASILKYENDQALIDTFLLSCRALGRKIEYVLLMECMKLSKLRSKKVIFGQYISSNKNMQVKDFYESKGFSTIQNSEVSIYKYDLESYTYEIPSFFKNITTEVELL